MANPVANPMVNPSDMAPQQQVDPLELLRRLRILSQGAAGAPQNPPTSGTPAGMTQGLQTPATAVATSVAKPPMPTPSSPASENAVTPVKPNAPVGMTQGQSDAPQGVASEADWEKQNPAPAYQPYVPPGLGRRLMTGLQGAFQTMAGRPEAGDQTVQRMLTAMEQGKLANQNAPADAQAAQDARYAQYVKNQEGASAADRNTASAQLDRARAANEGAPGTKAQDAIRQEMAKMGYNVAFNPDGSLKAATPIEGFKPSEKPVTMTDQQGAAVDDLMKTVNPATQKPYTRTEAIHEVEQQAAAMKGAYGSFGPAYLAARVLNDAYQKNPALLPILAPVLAQMLSSVPGGEGAPGAGTPGAGAPGKTSNTEKVLAAVPAGQPVDQATGKPIGLSQPGAPTGTTRSAGQFAEKALARLPEIRDEIKGLDADLGPLHGRGAEFLLGKVGSSG